MVLCEFSYDGNSAGTCKCNNVQAINIAIDNSLSWCRLHALHLVVVIYAATNDYTVHIKYIENDLKRE